MLRLFESGRNQLHIKRFYDLPFKAEEINEVNPITIEQVIMPFVVLCGGAFLSLVVVILEKLLKKRIMKISLYIEEN